MLTRNHPTRRKKKMILCVRNRIENDFKKMKQYYGNENYIQLFIEKRWERERERERSGLKIFLSDMSDHIWLLNTKWLKLNQRWKSLNAICGTWLNYHSNSRYDIHYILFLRTHIYFSMVQTGVVRKLYSNKFVFYEFYIHNVYVIQNTSS